jgi:hypothetical protein
VVYMKRILMLVLLTGVLVGCRHKVKPERVGDEFGASGAELQYGTCKDCIPALDNPLFESREEAEGWLKDEDLVLGLDYQGEHKAYPVKIMNWHEIVNDRVIVTYSALCGSAVGFESEVKWRVSGRLKDGCLVMYNKETNELVSQLDGDLERVPVQVLAWGEWSRGHPATVVLSRLGIRDYTVNPYPDLAQAEVVYGVKVGGETKDYSLETIKQETVDDGVLMDVVGGEKIRLSYTRGEILVENLKTKQRLIPLRRLSR